MIVAAFWRLIVVSVVCSCLVLLDVNGVGLILRFFNCSCSSRSRRATTPVVDAVAADPVTRSCYYSSTCRCDCGCAVGGSGPVALAVSQSHSSATRHEATRPHS